MKKIIIGIVVVLVIVFFVAENGTKIEEGKEVYKIGGVYALTSVGAPVGEEIQKGTQMAVDEINESGGINGHLLELISEDLSLDKIKDAHSVVQVLANVHKVKAIVGAQWDEPNEAIVPFIEASKIVTISPDTTDYLLTRNETDYFMSTWFDNKKGIDEVLKFADENNLRKISIVRFFDSGFWKYVSDYMTLEASKYNIEIIDDVTTNSFDPTIDYRTELSKIMQNKPDAIFAAISAPVTCPFIKQLSELGYEGKFLATESAGNKDSLESCPELLSDFLYFSHPSLSHAKYLEFSKNFETKYGYTPVTPNTATAYDAVYLIAEGLKITNGEGGLALKNAIRNIEDFEGASQPKINLKENGFVETPDDAFLMKTIRGGKFEVVEFVK